MNTIANKVGENEHVMAQIANNPTDRILLGDFPKAIDDAVISSGAAHQNQMTQLITDGQKMARFTRLVLDLLKAAG